MFSDSVGSNVELLNELLRGMPGPAQKRAHQTAVIVERVINQLKADHPKDPAVALGTAWCIFQIAQQIVASEQTEGRAGLIQLIGS